MNGFVKRVGVMVRLTLDFFLIKGKYTYWFMSSISLKAKIVLVTMALQRREHLKEIKVFNIETRRMRDYANPFQTKNDLQKWHNMLDLIV